MYQELYNARAQLLFGSLNLLFRDVAVAIAVVVFLSSLILTKYWRVTWKGREGRAMRKSQGCLS